MRLVILRHAIAEAHGTPGVAEDDRPLTAEGIARMQKAAGGLRTLEPAPGLILTSPLPRARQTAEIVAEAFSGKHRPPLRVVDALAPGGRRQDVYRAIAASGDLECIMLVGHQPSLGEIAGEVAWGSAERYVELKKGGACAIDLDETQPTPAGSLVWLLTPAILRALAG